MNILVLFIVLSVIQVIHAFRINFNIGINPLSISINRTPLPVTALFYTDNYEVHPDGVFIIELSSNFVGGLPSMHFNDGPTDLTAINCNVVNNRCSFVLTMVYRSGRDETTETITMKSISAGYIGEDQVFIVTYPAGQNTPPPAEFKVIYDDNSVNGVVYLAKNTVTRFRYRLTQPSGVRQVGTKLTHYPSQLPNNCRILVDPKIGQTSSSIDITSDGLGFVSFDVDLTNVNCASVSTVSILTSLGSSSQKRIADPVYTLFIGGNPPAPKEPNHTYKLVYDNSPAQDIVFEGINFFVQFSIVDIENNPLVYAAGALEITPTAFLAFYMREGDEAFIGSNTEFITGSNGAFSQNIRLSANEYIYSDEYIVTMNFISYIDIKIPNPLFKYTWKPEYGFKYDQGFTQSPVIKANKVIGLKCTLGNRKSGDIIYGAISYRDVQLILLPVSNKVRIGSQNGALSTNALIRSDPNGILIVDVLTSYSETEIMAANGILPSFKICTVPKKDTYNVYEYPVDMFTVSFAPIVFCNGVSDVSELACSGRLRGSCEKRVGDVDAKCYCSFGYGGANCNEFYCGLHNNKQCNGHGTCTGTQICTCDTGWTGYLCQLAICDGKTSETGACSNKGVCAEPGSCVCATGYSGQNCEYFACRSVDNVYLPANHPNVCSGNGQCNGPDTCTCKTDPSYGAQYQGNNCQYPICFTKASNDPAVCSSHGICATPNSCVCLNNWGGSQCQTGPCFGVHYLDQNACSGHGTCLGLDNCRCDSGRWTGSKCDIPMCSNIPATDPTVCSGRGKCTSFNVCDCTGTGFGGTICHRPICNQIVQGDANSCSGNGTCISPEVCTCKTGFTGKYCDSWTCNSIDRRQQSVCTGHGQCTAYNVCTCRPGCTGTNCENWSCGNVHRTDTGVCSRNGTCIDSDTCQCKTGQYGSDCQFWDCYGRRMDHQIACNNHNGSCVAPDQCLCQKSYYGEVCQYYNCNGWEHYYLESCSLKGYCIAPENCTCFKGYIDKNCGRFTCFGIPQNISLACSTNGTCVDVDTCSCKNGFYGVECEFYNCYGFKSTTRGICSGNGYCIAPNVCLCKTGYTGVICEELISSSMNLISNEVQVGTYLIITMIIAAIITIPTVIIIFVLKTTGVYSFKSAPALDKVK